MPHEETPDEIAERERLIKLAEGFKQQPNILGSPAAKPAAPVKQYDSDLIPEVEAPQISDQDRALDSFLADYDIVQAYRTFIGKMEPKESDRRKEGIKISCPIPGHVDNDPSAWANTEKNLWYCGGCQQGGDIYDLGAIYFGYPLGSYKTDGSFRKLKYQMAERLGHVVQTYTSITGKTTRYITPDPVPEYDPAEAPDEEDQTVAPVVPLHAVETYALDDDEDEDDIELIKNPDVFIDWHKILPENTYMWEWMIATTIDDLPHEYYFWQGLMALAFALGGKTFLRDFKAVRANLYLCLYGRTGVGKSRSIYPMLELLKAVMPYDDSDLFAAPTGVKQIPTPGSAEGLLDSFKHEIKDPSTMAVVDRASVAGLVKIEELSSFIARASRQGSALREMIMDMYDVFGHDLTLNTRSSGVTRVHDPFVQFITTTQPKAIHAYLRRTDMETGFLNRWGMIAGGSRRAPMSHGGAQPDLTKAIEKLKEIKLWADGGKKMELHGDALDVWDNFFHEKIAPYKTGELDMESIMSRIDLHLKKVMILMTGNLMEDHPTKDTVAMATSLYPYLSTTFSAFSRDIAFNDVTECQNKITGIIENYFLKTGTFPSAREIRQRIGKKFDSEMLIRAMKNLVQLDVIFEDASQIKRGRPTKRYGLPGLKKPK